MRKTHKQIGKRISFFLTALLILSCLGSVAQADSSQPQVNEATTFVLSNEEGGEIDWYQYSGYAGYNLYQFLVKIQAHSNGVITDEFLATLAACPANSAIFTTTLYDYRGQTQSICINSDGTVKLLNILGRDYYGQTGYTTCWDNYTNSGAFTYTNDSAYFIDAGTNSSGESYKAFAVYWAPILEYQDVATFVLTNEAGGLLDQLIADGYGDYNVYQTMQRLKPRSGGVITDEFMASLAACPADSDIFTVPLSILVEYGNYPLCINEDGTLHISPIYGRDLYQKTGYANYPDSSTATMMFTYPTSVDYLINAGSGYFKGIVYPYKAFGIAWAPAKEGKTFVLSNEEGGLIDQLIAAGYGDDSLYQTLVNLQDTSNGIISDKFLETLANCPADSEIFNTKLSDYTGLNNPVCINSDGTVRVNDILGRDYYNKTGYATYPESSGLSAKQLFTYATDASYYIDAGSSVINSDSGSIRTYYKAFAIAWAPESPEATTFVLSNEEGGLIDQLIAEGYGNSNLYETLVALEPGSGGVITEEFLATLAACPAGSEIFTASLSNYKGLNNPVGINTDGSLIICPVFGRNYYGKTGYATYPENLALGGNELFTYAIDSSYYIDTGSSVDTYEDGSSPMNYKAFAIAWAPETSAPALVAPVISPESGSYNDKVTVTITGSGGTIYFTSDGTDPTTSSTKTEYTVPFELSQSATIKAAVYSNTAWSEVASKNYNIESDDPYPMVIFSITDNAKKIVVGSELTYKINLTNTGNTQLTNVRIVDQLPSGVTFVSADGATFDEDTKTVTFDIGTVMPTNSVIAKITVKTTELGLVENTATMYCDQLEPISCKDTTTVTDQQENIPEFPTVALPMMVVIGIGFVFMRRRE